MWFSSLSALWRSGTPRTGSKPPPRLAVEVLEDRTVPSALGRVPPPHPGGVAALVQTHGSIPQHSVPAQGSADGQVILQINPTPDNPVGVQVYEAAGQSTLLGRYTQRGITFFTADGDVTGSFVMTAADGSTVSGSYSGTVAPIPGTTDFEFNVKVVFESGTGRLAGITGGADVVAVLDGQTGAFHYDFSGDWIRP
jgi:hypothetical protein